MRPMDFSRQVLSPGARHLVTLRLGNMEWHDLGNPDQVVSTVLARNSELPFLAYCVWHDLAQGYWPDIPAENRRQYDIGQIKAHLRTFLTRFFGSLSSSGVASRMDRRWGPEGPYRHAEIIGLPATARLWSGSSKQSLSRIVSSVRSGPYTEFRLGRACAAFYPASIFWLL